MPGTSVTTGIDPDRLRTLRDAAGALSETAGHEASIGRTIINTYQLQGEEGDAITLCNELSEETDLLAQIAAQKATQIELAAQGIFVPVDTSLYEKLADSIGSDLLESEPVKAEVEDPRITELKDRIAQAKANGEFDPDWVDKEMDNAAKNDDEEAIQVISEELMDHLEELEQQVDPKTRVPGQAALDFVEDLNPATMVIAIDSAGFREIPSVYKFVAKAGAHMVSFDNSTPGLSGYAARLLRSKGYVPEGSDRAQEEVTAWGIDLLEGRANRSEADAKDVFEAITWTEIEPDQRGEQVIQLALEIAEKYPEVLPKLLDNSVQAEHFMRMLARSVTQAEIDELFMKFVQFSAEAYDANADTYDITRMDAVARFYYELIRVGHGPSIDFVPLLDYIAGKTPGVSDAVSLGQTIDDMIVRDGTADQREAQWSEDVEQQNAALLILAATKPELAKQILNGLGAESIRPPGLTEEQWNLLDSESAKYGDAAEELAKIKHQIEDVWQ